jgi:hypothetical protein
MCHDRDMHNRMVGVACPTLVLDQTGSPIDTDADALGSYEYCHSTSTAPHGICKSLEHFSRRPAFSVVTVIKATWL